VNDGVILWVKSKIYVVILTHYDTVPVGQPKFMYNRDV